MKKKLRIKKKEKIKNKMRVSKKALHQSLTTM